MAQKLMQIMALLTRAIGVTTIYLGLILLAAHYFTWGLVVLMLGLAALGLNEEGGD